MKGFSIYQSNFELRYGLINSYFSNELLYTYVVGHGMYIRVDLLKRKLVDLKLNIGVKIYI